MRLIIPTLADSARTPVNLPTLDETMCPKAKWWKALRFCRRYASSKTVAPLRKMSVLRSLAEEGEAATLHDLAAEFQVSAERIRQIEVKAMQKMRALIAA